MVHYETLSIDCLGHASVRIESDGGTVVYIDPWSSALAEDPHDADVVLVSHDDHDHYDPEGIRAVATDETVVLAYEGVDTSDLGMAVEHLVADETTTAGGISVRGVPAYNAADGPHVDEDGNPFHAKGEVLGLLVTIDDVVVYYPSDTDFLDHHEEITCDVFIPPIGGHYTMDRHEAAAFARSVGSDLVIPIHYDTFEAIQTDADAFREELEAEGIRVEILL
jgi:L-ascorbate metabolism protein UlaG (beta-lactamase superfamily)